MNRGVTLIELAVSIFIITLLAGGILVPLAAQVESRQIRDTQRMLAEAQEALLGFAAVNGHLPCPDRTNDGVEDVGGSVCAPPIVGGVSVGNLPHATLGLTAHSDPWGNRLRYAVTAAFAQRDPTIIHFGAWARLRVCTTFACNTPATILTNFNPMLPAGPTNPIGDEAVAVILSHGKNGLGAVRYPSGDNPPPTSADEIANLGGGNFISRPPSGLGSANGEFDDIVIWFGRSVLFKNMVAAGKLP